MKLHTVLLLLSCFTVTCNLTSCKAKAEGPSNEYFERKEKPSEKLRGKKQKNAIKSTKRYVRNSKKNKRRVNNWNKDATRERRIGRFFKIHVDRRIIIKH